MESLLIEHDLKFVEAKAKVERIQNEIKKKVKKSETMFKKIIKMIRETEEKNNKNVCAWVNEMKYFNIAKEIEELGLDFGGFLKGIWKDAIKLEELRIVSVKKVMTEILSIQRSIFTYNVRDICEKIEGIQEKCESLEISKLFKEIEIKELENIGIYQDYIEKLSNWRPEKIHPFDWILKEGAIYRESGVFQQWEQCYGVIVKSNYFHLFQNKPILPFVEPLESVCLKNATILISKTGENFAEICEEKNSSNFFKKLIIGKKIIFKAIEDDNIQNWIEIIHMMNK